ncbi:MAG: hypothetical protein LQ343_000933 [Gyalolechia ehrenbergii]|nr:MAG: hypothetical protein LQ343_000933 [Gyalolechia ehrenbergii]
MHSYIQFITTPTADTAGTAMLFDVGRKRYLFGNIHEGLQRACIQRNAKLAKTTEVFITGKTEWKTIGGLFGVILTLADANASAAKSELENSEKRKTEETSKQIAAKAERKAKFDEERARVFREAGLVPEEHLASPGNVEKTQTALPTLTIHGGKNLTHTVATGRRFILRKGMPIQISEHVQSQGHEPTPNGRDPDWADDSIQVWKMSIQPSTDNQSPEVTQESHRKRAFDDFAAGDLPSRRYKEASEDLLRSDELRRSVVSDMFNSQWRLDTLFETPFSKVRNNTPMWTRNKETNKVERYYLPENEPLPDINVLVRHPWPGSLVDELPPSKPSQAALSYIIRHHPQKGKFMPGKAKELNVHQYVFQALQRGFTVKSRDGILVTPDMVLEPSRTGGGFALVDLPSVDHIRDLVNRPEWKMPRVMDGLQAIMWNLGPEVAKHPALRSFLTQHSNLKHIVSSPDILPNYLAFDSSSALVIRLNQIDAQRYPIPIHSNVVLTDTLPNWSGNSNLPAPDAATRDLQVQLEPCLKIQEAPDTQRFLDTRSILEITPKEVLELARNTKSEITSGNVTEKLAGQDLPSQDAEIICLGTGSSAPSKYRNVSATLLRVPGSGSYLFDCGEGTLGQLKRLYKPMELKEVLQDLKAMWISHLHADHHLGTTSVIKAWYEAVHGLSDAQLKGLPPDEEQTNPIETLQSGKRLFIFAGQQMIRWLKEYSSVEDFGYNQLVPISTHIFDKDAPSAPRMEWNGVPLDFRTKDACMNKAMRDATGMTDLVTCGVAHCHDAQAIAVTFPTGFKFSYSGDCRPSRHFVRIGQGSTVVVHEATFDDAMQDDAEAKKHSTMSEAIGVAQAMGAKRLILTHFSQRYQKIPLLGALDKIKVKFDDSETASNGAEDVNLLNDPEVIDTATDPNNFLSERQMPTPPPKTPIHSPSSSQSSSMSLARPEELKVAIAFDFLRVRAGDIPHLEKYTPVLQRMFELLEAEDKAKAKDHPSEVARREKAEEKERKRQDLIRTKETKEAQKQARIESLRQARKQGFGKEGKMTREKENIENDGGRRQQMADTGAAEWEDRGIGGASGGQELESIQAAAEREIAQLEQKERGPSLPLPQDPELQPSSSLGTSSP